MDNNLVFRTFVKFKRKENIRLTVTNANLIFEEEKGIFKKKFKSIEEIDIRRIVVYKDKVQIKHKKNNISIETFDKTINFECKDILEATKVKEEILSIMGYNVLERTKNKVNKLSGIVKGVGAITAAAVAIPKGIKVINKNKKEIVNTIKNIATSLKK